MPTLFSQIIAGDVPARFVWKDPVCVGFLTIAPIRRGHVLVVPRQEVDHWLDAPPELMSHLTETAQTIGQAIQSEYQPTRVGMMIAGFEIPHLHMHVLPIDTMADMDFGNADDSVSPSELDDDAARIVAALRAAGHEPGA